MLTWMYTASPQHGHVVSLVIAVGHKQYVSVPDKLTPFDNVTPPQRAHLVGSELVVDAGFMMPEPCLYCRSDGHGFFARHLRSIRPVSFHVHKGNNRAQIIRLPASLIKGPISFPCLLTNPARDASSSIASCMACFKWRFVDLFGKTPLSTWQFTELIEINGQLIVSAKRPPGA